MKKYYLNIEIKTTKMKQVILLVLLLIPFFLLSQNPLDSLIKEGIALHDAGDYDAAIKKYKEALNYDEKSSLAYYELGLTSYTKGDYKKSAKYADKVLKIDDGYLREAFTLKGSALDNLGKTKAAIKTYEKAIEAFPKDHLLYFNLALTRYNAGLADEAEQDLKKGLQVNPSHSTSNYLLGIIKMEQGRRVESLLAFHFFLLLEPNTAKSKEALARVSSLMNEGVTKKDEKNIEINLAALGEEDDFSTANLMLSLLSASNMTEENENKSKEQLFYENTESLFSVLNEQKEGKTGLWWDFYVNFYGALLDAGHLETYCYFIRQQNGEAEQKWIAENNEKVEQFFQWLQE